MISEDKTKLAALLVTASRIYDKPFDISQEQDRLLARAFFVTLEKFNIEQVEKGFMKHFADTNSGQFFPKPANVITQIQGTEKQQLAKLEARAMMAWVVIESRLSNGRINLDDKVASAALKGVGGMAGLGRLNSKDISFKKIDFIKLYSIYSESSCEELPDGLPGREELLEYRAKVNTALLSNGTFNRVSKG